MVIPDSDSPDGYKYRPATPISEISEELPVLDVYNAIRTLEKSYSDSAPIDGVISECREKTSTKTPSEKLSKNYGSSGKCTNPSKARSAAPNTPLSKCRKLAMTG